MCMQILHITNSVKIAKQSTHKKWILDPKWDNNVQWTLSWYDNMRNSLWDDPKRDLKWNSIHGSWNAWVTFYTICVTSKLFSCFWCTLSSRALLFRIGLLRTKRISRNSMQQTIALQSTWCPNVIKRSSLSAMAT